MHTYFINEGQTSGQSKGKQLPSGGFLVFDLEAFSGLDFNLVTDTLYGKLTAGSIDYWKVVLKSKGHGYINEEGWFNCFDTEMVTDSGGINDVGAIRFSLGKNKVAHVIDVHHNLVFILAENGEGLVWAFVPGFGQHSFTESPRAFLLAQLDFDQLVNGIKEIGLDGP